jgi:hypothetical protein
MEIANSSTCENLSLESLKGMPPNAYMRLQDKGVMCLDTCSHCKNCYKNDWHLFFRLWKSKISLGINWNMAQYKQYGVECGEFC